MFPGTSLFLMAALGGTTTVPVFSGSVGINPEQAMWYTLAVPPGHQTATLEGHFTASGGNGNDIEVFVLDENGLTNWRNGHQVGTYYNSRRITTDNVFARLQPGRTYYLVLSNRFSLLSAKTVAGEIKLKLTKPDPPAPRPPPEHTLPASFGLLQHDQRPEPEMGPLDFIASSLSQSEQVAVLGLIAALIVVVLVAVVRSRSRPLGMHTSFASAGPGLDLGLLANDTAPGSAGFCSKCGQAAVREATYCHCCGARLLAQSAG